MDRKSGTGTGSDGKKRKTGRRSSILKIKSPSRTALCDLSANPSGSTGRPAKSRRVSFAHTYQLKEFQKDVSPDIPVIDAADVALDTGMAPAGQHISGLQSLLTGPLRNETGVTFQESVFTENHVQEVPMPNESDDSGFIPIQQTGSVLGHSMSGAAPNHSNVSSSMVATSSSGSMHDRWANETTKCFDFSTSTMNFTMCNNDENTPPMAVSTNTRDRTQHFQDESCMNMNFTECISTNISISSHVVRSRNMNNQTQIFDGEADGMETTMCVGGVKSGVDPTSQKKLLSYSAHEGHSQNKTQFFDNDTSCNDMDFTGCVDSSLHTSIPGTSAAPVSSTNQLIDTQSFLAGLMTKSQPNESMKKTDSPASDDKIDTSSFLSSLTRKSSNGQHDSQPASYPSLAVESSPPPKLDTQTFLSSLTRKPETVGSTPEVLPKLATTSTSSAGSFDTHSFLSSLKGSQSILQNESLRHDATLQRQESKGEASKIDTKSFLASLTRKQSDQESSSYSRPYCESSSPQKFDTHNFLAGLTKKPGSKAMGEPSPNILMTNTSSRSSPVMQGQTHGPSVSASAGTQSQGQSQSHIESCGTFDTNNFLASLTKKSSDASQEKKSEPVTSGFIDTTNFLASLAGSKPVDGRKAVGVVDKYQANDSQSMEEEDTAGMEFTCMNMPSVSSAASLPNPHSDMSVANKTRHFLHDQTAGMEMTCLDLPDMTITKSDKHLDHTQRFDDKSGKMEMTCMNSSRFDTTNMDMTRTDGLSNVTRKFDDEDLSAGMEFTCVGLPSLASTNTEHFRKTNSPPSNDSENDAGMEFTCTNLPSLMETKKVNQSEHSMKSSETTKLFVDSDHDDMEMTCMNIHSLTKSESDQTKVKHGSNMTVRYEEAENGGSMELTCMNMTVAEKDQTMSKVKFSEVTRVYEDEEAESAASMDFTCMNMTSANKDQVFSKTKFSDVTKVFGEDDEADGMEMTCIQPSSGSGMHQDLSKRVLSETTTAMDFTCMNLTSVEKDQTMSKVKYSDVTKVYGEEEGDDGMEMTCTVLPSSADVQLDLTTAKPSSSDVTRRFTDEQTGEMDFTCMNLTTANLNKSVSRVRFGEVTRVFNDDEQDEGMEMTCMVPSGVKLEMSKLESNKADATRKFEADESIAGMELTCVDLPSNSTISISPGVTTSHNDLANLGATSSAGTDMTPVNTENSLKVVETGSENLEGVTDEKDKSGGMQVSMKLLMQGNTTKLDQSTAGRNDDIHVTVGTEKDELSLDDVSDRLASSSESHVNYKGRESVASKTCRFEDSMDFTCMPSNEPTSEIMIHRSRVESSNVQLAEGATLSGDKTVYSERTHLMEMTACVGDILPSEKISQSMESSRSAHGGHLSFKVDANVSDSIAGSSSSHDKNADRDNRSITIPETSQSIQGQDAASKMDAGIGATGSVKGVSSPHPAGMGMESSVRVSSAVDDVSESPHALQSVDCHLSAVKSAPMPSVTHGKLGLHSIATAPLSKTLPRLVSKDATTPAPSPISRTSVSHQETDLSSPASLLDTDKSPKRSNEHLEGTSPNKLVCTRTGQSDSSLQIYEYREPRGESEKPLAKVSDLIQGGERLSSDDHSASDLENEVLPSVPIDTDSAEEEARPSQVDVSQPFSEPLELPSCLPPSPKPDTTSSSCLSQVETQAADVTRKSGRGDISEWSTMQVSSMDMEDRTESMLGPIELNTFDDYLRALNINLWAMNTQYRHSSIYPDNIPELETLREKLEVHCITQHEVDLAQLSLEQLNHHINKLNEMAAELEGRLMQDPPLLLQQIKNGSEEELEQLKEKCRKILSTQLLLAKVELKQWKSKMQTNLVELLEDEESKLYQEVEKFKDIQARIDVCLKNTDNLNERVAEHLQVLQESLPTEEQQTELEELEKLNSLQLEELEKAKEELLVAQQKCESLQQQKQKLELEMGNHRSIKDTRRESEKLVKVNLEQIDNLKGCLEWELEHYDDKLIFVTFLWKSLEFKIDLGEPLESNPEFQHIIDMNFETHLTGKAPPANVFVHRIILEHLSTTKLLKAYPTTQYLREMLHDVSTVFCDARLLGEDLVYTMARKQMSIRGCNVTLKSTNPMAKLMFDVTFTFDPSSFQHSLPTWKIKSFTGEGIEELHEILTTVSPGVGHFRRLISAMEDLLCEKAKLQHQQGFTLGFKVVTVDD